MTYDMKIIEAHAKRPAPNWQTCECSSCEKRRELRVLADILMEADEDYEPEDSE